MPNEAQKAARGGRILNSLIRSAVLRMHEAAQWKDKGSDGRGTKGYYYHLLLCFFVFYCIIVAFYCFLLYPIVFLLYFIVFLLIVFYCFFIVCVLS